MNLLQEITLLRATGDDVSSRLGVRAMTLLIAFMVLGLFQSITYTGAVAVAAGSLPADFADTGGKLPATIGGGQWDDIFAEAGANGPVKALVTAPDGTLYAGGQFTTIAGQTVNRIAASPTPAPVAVDNTYTTLLNTALTVAAPGVLGNDSTGQGGALTAILTTSPSNGALTLNQNGSFTYIPNAGFIGEDNFTYTAGEGSVSSNEAIVGIKVEALPQGPAGHTVFLPLVLK